LRAVEIFAGAGGLALGVSEAGFKHDAVIERDKYACATIRANKSRRIKPVVDWPLFEEDISQFDFSTIDEGLDLLCGGPPCQPFSLAGKSLGRRDKRDLFPQAIRAVRELKPRAFVFENVKGLLRNSHVTYSEYVRLQLAYPHLKKGHGEKWKEHLSRLERYHTKGVDSKDQSYKVIVHSANAADYGVPQRRERVFFVGIRADLRAEWAFPPPTHSRDELLVSKFIAGDYWERHEVSRKKREAISASVKERLRKRVADTKSNRFRPWVTIRDALMDLPAPGISESNTLVANHVFIPGARSYDGHAGSEIDQPAKTLKAGDHGVPGGENMLLHVNGKVRYFTVREKARLQTFPDKYRFDGPWSATTRQLGNAVPVLLSSLIAKSLKNALPKS
jgi:DNA (cytosine-5)-methyltransferase 1